MKIKGKICPLDYLIKNIMPEFYFSQALKI